MKLTNNLNLPEPIIKAIENDPYDNGSTWSVTTLLRPPQAVSLGAAHSDEIEEDAADRIWALVGQVGHAIIERASASLDPKVWITERRFYIELDGEIVSGQADLIHSLSGTTYDTKYTSYWAVKDALEGGKSDWTNQLSMLGVMARGGKWMEFGTDAVTGDRVIILHDGDSASPVDIKRGKILAIMRDWERRKAQRDPKYYQHPIASIEMPIMGHEETLEWMRQRIAEHKAARAGNPRPCTDEERWHRPGKWAVYKLNKDGTRQQKAAKLEDTEDGLSAWIFANRAKLGEHYKIEERPSEYKRCASYCSAAQFCRQHLEFVAVNGSSNDQE